MSTLAAFRQLTAALPEDDHEVVLSALSLPEPPHHADLDDVVIIKSFHHHQGYLNARFDTLILFARPATLRMLGLLVLARLFHPKPTPIRLDLTHPASSIRALVLDFDPDEQATFVPGYRTRAESLTWWPKPSERFPLSDRPFPTWLLPAFNLTNEENVISAQPQDWEARDIVRCAGTDVGNVLLGEVLLNASLPGASPEIDLETDVGLGGVAPGSPQLRITLPESLGWHEEWF
jgi:hypothetical protein